MGVTVTVGEQDAYLARVGRVGMLLLPMITGIGEQVRAWADELAGEGITALAWDPFKGLSTDNTSRQELSGLLRQMDDDTALAEQSALLDYLFRHISENHDLQVRYKWGVNDLAIWDNRATFHTATYVFSFCMCLFSR